VCDGPAPGPSFYVCMSFHHFCLASLMTCIFGTHSAAHFLAGNTQIDSGSTLTDPQGSLAKSEC
jgi:hypothetical protein